MPILTDLAGQLANAAGTPLPDPDRGVLSLHLLDTVGATLTGAATADGQSAFRFLSGGGFADHAAANCTATRLSEIDDIHLPSGCTPGSIIVPTALTMSAYLKVHDPDRVSAALVAGLVLNTAEADDWKSLSAGALESAGALKSLQEKYLSIWEG